MEEEAPVIVAAHQGIAAMGRVTGFRLDWKLALIIDFHPTYLVYQAGLVSLRTNRISHPVSTLIRCTVLLIAVPLNYMEFPR
jgi:hypothetical protein